MAGLLLSNNASTISAAKQCIDAHRVLSSSFSRQYTNCISVAYISVLMDNIKHGTEYEVGLKIKIHKITKIYEIQCTGLQFLQLA